ALVAADIAVVAGERDVASAAQQAVRVVGQVALEVVVQRIAVEQRTGADQDEALILVANIDESIQQRDGGVLVLLVVIARRVGRQRRRSTGILGVGRLDVELLADRRHRSGEDLLGKSLVIDKGDVEHLQTGGAAGTVGILAAVLHTEDLGLA